MGEMKEFRSYDLFNRISALLAPVSILVVFATESAFAAPCRPPVPSRAQAFRFLRSATAHIGWLSGIVASLTDNANGDRHAPMPIFMQGSERVSFGRVVCFAKFMSTQAYDLHGRD